MSSPRPQPRSSTRDCGSTHSPITCMSTVRFSIRVLMWGRRSDREIEDIGLVALEEAAYEGVEGFALQEERVVPEVGRELGVAGPLAGPKEGERDGPVLLWREEPVAREADDQRLGAHGRERPLQRPVRARGV